MRLVPINELYGYGHDETIPSCKGILVDLQKQTSGTSRVGPWQIQNGTLRGSDGTEIKVKFKDRDEIPASFKGKLVYLSCSQGERGLTGLKVKDDSYKENTVRILSVTSTANIELEDAPAQQPPARQEPTRQQQQARPPAAPAPAQKHNENPPPTDPLPQEPEGEAPPKAPKYDVKAVRKSLNQLANLYLHCLNAGDYVRDRYNAQVREHNATLDPEKAVPIPQMSVDQHQACVSSIYIQATKQFMQSQIPPGDFAST